MPTAPVSVAVALADKLDTLSGFWAIDEKPTGSKDPFALRRAALGVIRLVLGNGVRLGLRATVGSAMHQVLADLAVSNQIVFLSPPDSQRDAKDVATEMWEQFEHPPSPAEIDSGHQVGAPLSRFRRFEVLKIVSVARLAWLRDVTAAGLSPTAKEIDPEAISSDLFAFLHDRLKVHLREQGIRHDVIDAVLAMPGNDDLTLVVARATALNAMLATEDGTNLLQGLKRAANILAQAEDKDGVEYSFGADPKFAETDAERALFAALDAAEPRIEAAMQAEDFPAAMAAIAALRAPIDAFFEAVQVNSDNQVLRRNRLNLLHRIRETGRRIADFARIEG